MTGGTPAVRLTVTIRAHEHSGHHLLATELLRRARRAGLAGATLLATGDRAEVVVVDAEEAVEAFVAANAATLARASVVVEPVRAYRA